MSQGRTSGIIFFLIASFFLLGIGTLSLLLGARETVTVDLAVKIFLFLLIIVAMAQNGVLSPCEPSSTLTASLVLLGVFVASGAIREWGGGV